MKLISVGDSAGKRCWEDIDGSKYDYVIMLGDLVDPRDGIAEWQVVDNLKNLIAVKRKEPEKRKYVLGNHDCYYLYYGDKRFQISWDKNEFALEIQKLFTENIDCFQIAFQVENYLFTHAGVTKKWWHYRETRVKGDIVEKSYYKDSHPELSNSNFLEKVEYPSPEERSKDFATVADTINAMWRLDPHSIAHVGPGRYGGDPCGGPIWCDDSEINRDSILDGYHQVVGHNRVRDFKTITKDKDTSLTFTDVLDYQIKFYGLEI